MSYISTISTILIFDIKKYECFIGIRKFNRF